MIEFARPSGLGYVESPIVTCRIVHGPRRQAFFLRFGTFAPARRASDSPIAIACLRDFTFLPDLPLRRVPAFRSCIALATFLPLALLYLRAIDASFKYVCALHIPSAGARGCQRDSDLSVGIGLLAAISDLAAP